MSPDPKLDKVVKAYRTCVTEAALNSATGKGNPNSVITRCDGLLADYRQVLMTAGMPSNKAVEASAKLKDSTRKAVGGLLIAAAIQ